MVINKIDYDAADLEAVELAIKTVLEMKLPEEVFISADLLTMGKRLSRIYTRKYEQVAEIHGVNNLGKLAALANKYYWISCHEAANIMKACSLLGKYDDFDIDEKLKSAEGYADYEGWAHTLYDYASTIQTCDTINGEGFKDDVLIFIGLHWLNIAEKLQENSDKFDYIAEALNAFELHSSYDMYSEGLKVGQYQAKEIRSNAGKKGIENKPIPIALKEIEMQYQSVKSRFKRGGYGAQFVREMHAKYPVIVDRDTINRLVTKLKKSNE